MANCKSCGKSIGFFSSSKTCCKCGGKVCGDCAKVADGTKYEYPLLYLSKLFEVDKSKFTFWAGNACFCKSCWNNVSSKLYRMSACTGNDVRTFTANYQGRTPRGSKSRIYQTEFYKDRKDAFDEIKIVAEYLDSNAVVDINILREVEEEDNYKYSVWAIEGKILI